MIDLRLGNCLEVIKSIPDKSIDLVLTDPPYGVTANKNDITVDLSELFRVSKAVVITSQQPFTTKVISQFIEKFRYDLVWDKELVTGFLNAKRQPLRRHENILVFGSPKCYNPQMSKGKPLHSVGSSAGLDPKQNRNYGKFKINSDERSGSTEKYPTSIIHFRKPHPSIAVHPTEKPIELMEYLMKTFSNENDLILDPFMGSGTTGIAAKKLNRKFIGIELDEKYFEIAKKRINESC